MPTPIEATGHSDTPSFDEAFRKAISALDEMVPKHPDYQLDVVVSKITGVFGGIAGLHRISVTVQSEKAYDK